MGGMRNTEQDVPGRIRIAARGGKAHYENPGQQGGDAATLCGQGADYISATGDPADCARCVKAWAKRVHMEAVNAEVMARAAERHATEAEKAPAVTPIGDTSGLTAASLMMGRLLRSAMESPTVVVTGGRVHREGVPCGRVYDGDTIAGVDTDAGSDCVDCWGQPGELIAGDGTMIRVGSRVVATDTHDGVPVVGTVESLGYFHEGEWVLQVGVVYDADGLPYGHSAMMMSTYVEPTLGERMAAEEAALTNETGPCRDCQLTVIWAHGMWIGADGDERCAASRTGAHRVPMCECAGGAQCAHEVHRCDSQAAVFTDYGHPRHEGRMCQPCQDVLDAALPVLKTSSDAARVTAGEWWGVDGEGDTGEIIGDADLATVVQAGRASVVITGDQMALTWLPEELVCTYVRRPVVPEASVADAGITAEVIHYCESILMRDDPRVAVVAECGMCQLEWSERRDVACGECGIMPHDMECLTGLRLESPTPRIDETVARMVAGEWSLAPTVGDDDAPLADWERELLAMSADSPTVDLPPVTDLDVLYAMDDEVPVMVEASRGPGYAIPRMPLVTAEDVAGLPTPESAAAAHNASRPWSAKGAKRKSSSVAVKRRQQLARAR